MVDNLKLRGPADRSRVNVNEAWEVTWWCKDFACTETELRQAVREVGVSVEKVRARIKTLQGNNYLAGLLRVGQPIGGK